MTWLSSQKDRYLNQLTKELFRFTGLKWTRKRTLGLTAVAFLTIISLVLSFSGIGVFQKIGGENLSLTDADLSSIPGYIVEDASKLAESLYGRSHEAKNYANQLLVAYTESMDKDVLILFNSGGWGLTSIQTTSDWESILDGVGSDLQDAGYRVATLNYYRTMNSVSSRINELKELFLGYISKAKDLASRIEFLTSYNPDLKVILAGESTGTAICDSTMNFLKDNDKVFSIQTGVPFWQESTIRSRTLVMNDNGIVRDAFSHGDIWVILSSSFKSLLGWETLDKGSILGFLSSPGHEYFWDEPGVYCQIEQFLVANFGIQPKASY